MMNVDAHATHCRMARIIINVNRCTPMPAGKKSITLTVHQAVSAQTFSDVQLHYHHDERHEAAVALPVPQLNYGHVVRSRVVALAC